MMSDLESAIVHMQKESETDGITELDADEAKAVLAEIERLRAIVDRLPKTADGVPVVPGVSVWHPHVGREDEVGEFSEEDWDHNGTRWFVAWGGPCHDAVPISDCYSTREAAEAARKAGG